MAIYLGILLFSFILTGILLVPFIDLLYKLHFTYHPQPTSDKKNEILETSQIAKIGTPVGGGVLLIVLVTLLYALLFPLMQKFGVYVTTVFPIKEELNIIFFTFISFGLVGLYDDIVKTFRLHTKKINHMSFGNKLALQFLFSLVTALMLYQNLDIQIVNIPFYGVAQIGAWYIPLATLVIFGFSKAFDITDGMDGLACGILLICLLAFWAVAFTALDTALSVFIALWIGSLIAFLYFNVYPARVWLGNAGSLAFGATLAVTGLLLGKSFALFVVGGVFLVDAASNVIQLGSTLFFHRKAFPVVPFHYWLQSRGWSEPKVVQRLWLISVMLALFGLWLAGV